MSDAQKRWTTPETIEQEFGYHPATEVTGPVHDTVREAVRGVAHILNELLPECPRKTEAIGYLRSAMWAANSAVACYGGQDEAWQEATLFRLGAVQSASVPGTPMFDLGKINLGKEPESASEVQLEAGEREAGEESGYKPKPWNGVAEEAGDNYVPPAQLGEVASPEVVERIERSLEHPEELIHRGRPVRRGEPVVLVDTDPDVVHSHGSSDRHIHTAEEYRGHQQPIENEQRY